MTGASPSACRAAVMQVFLLLAPLCRREYDMPTALAAAGLGLTVQNPWAIASVSFQLSFAAVAGLYCLSGPIRQWLIKRRLPDSLAAALSTTLAATAFTLPLSLLYFRTVSLVAPLTNLLCLWAVTGCFVLGIAACLAGPLGPLLAAPAGGWLRASSGSAAPFRAFPTRRPMSRTRPCWSGPWRLSRRWWGWRRWEDAGSGFGRRCWRWAFWRRRFGEEPP